MTDDDRPGQSEPVTPERRAEAARLVAETKEAVRRARADPTPRPPLSRHLEQAWSVPIGRTRDGRRQEPSTAAPDTEADTDRDVAPSDADRDADR